MTMKPLALIVSSLVLFTFVGCGGGGGDSADNSVAQSAPAPQNSAPSAPAEEYNPDSYDGDGGGYGDDGSSEGGYGGEGDEYGSGYDGDGGGYGDGDGEMYPGGDYGDGSPQRPPRPEKVADWTPEQIIEAITDSDTKVIEAFQLFASRNRGKPEAVTQYQEWMVALTKPATSSGGYGGEAEYGNMEMEEYGDYGSEGGYGGASQTSPKTQIAKSLLDLLAQNGTKEAYAIVRDVFDGKTELGLGEGEAEQIASQTLLKNLPDSNNPTRDLLWNALQSGNPESGEPFAEQALSLHLGLLTGTIDGLMGIPVEPAGNPRRGGGGDYGGGYDSEYGMEGGDYGGGGGYDGGGEGYPGGGGYGGEQVQQPKKEPVEFEPIEVEKIPLNSNQAESVVSYAWKQPLVDYATNKFLESPETTDHLLLVGQIPAKKTRNAIRQHFDSISTSSPDVLLAQEAFQKFLHDPAIHLITKLQPREERPTLNSNQPTRRSRNRTREREPDPEDESRKEASYGWLEASQQTLIGLMDRMNQAASQPDAMPFNPEEIPFALHRDAEVKKSKRFVVEPNSVGDNVAELETTIVNYVRIESDSLTERTVKHYRDVIRDEEQRMILNNKGMWLDRAVKPDRKSGNLKSVDVLLSRDGARRGQGENTGKFVVEILVVEVPDATVNAPQVSAVD